MENENGRSYFFRDLIVKILLVLLFIFLLVWLVPMPNLNPFYDKIFTQNLETMTDAAKGYYTVSRLPKNEGETSKLTLKDMIDNKMIIEFTDSEGKSCDVNKSYVEVTKKDGEYTFKTNLSCGETEDYVIEYFGCYDVCTDGKCQVEVVEKPSSNETKKITEYEFSKTSTTKYIEKYLCKDGYTLTGNKCVLDSEVEKIENASIKCLSGYNYNNSTKKCERVLTKEENAKLECPNGYVYAEGMNKCIKGTSDVVAAKEVYECSEGTLTSDNKCLVSSTKVVDATKTYSCPEGVKDGSWCIIFDTKTVAAKENYSCPNGGTLNGTSCIVTNTVQNPNVCNYTNWVCSNVTYSSTIGSSSSDTYTRNFLYKTGNNYVYQVCTRQYSCVSGGTSTTTSSYNATKTYSCPQGSLKGTECEVTTSRTEDAKVEYNCAEGTLEGTKCKINTTNTIDPIKKYVCDAGTLNGTKCEISGVTETNPTYTCSKGSLNGTKCEISYIDGLDPTYECKTGSLSVNKCVITSTTTDKVDATPVYKTTTSTQYKWARTETLDGWVRTGKTRTVNVTVTSR